MKINNIEIVGYIMSDYFMIGYGGDAGNNNRR
jgi:hypothetical protein